MALEVMDAERGNAERERERIGDAGADEERAGQPRPLGVGDGVDVREPGPRLAHHLADQRQHAPDVIARGEFGYHPAVFAVHRDLRMQRMCEQAALAVI